jgi:hypothetical protein
MLFSCIEWELPFFSEPEGGMREAQGQLGGVLEGVQVAGLEGHVSRSAVYLVH